jgi:hypothetical protein
MVSKVVECLMGYRLMYFLILMDAANSVFMSGSLNLSIIYDADIQAQ